MREYSDTQLVREYLMKANSLALEELVRRYAPLIYSFVRTYTGNTDAAADITQETFVKVWKHLTSYDQKQSFRTWIYTIAKRTAIDALKKKNALPFSVLQEDFAESVIDTAPLAIDALSLRQDMTMALARIPSHYARVIDLHVQQGLNFREISDQLKKPLNTVKSQYRRGLALLKAIVHQNR